MEENKTQLSEKEIARAVSNDPALSEVSFELGDRTFKIVDLAYDDYLAFLAELQPLVEAMFGSVMSSGSSLGELSAQSILKYCGRSLPEMVRIVCRQTDPDITTDEVKRLAKSPFKLAWVVLKQVEQNNMVKEFADFFGSIVPLVQMAMAGQKIK
jgi:hypothetical protein